MLQQAMNWLGFGLCHQLAERSFFGGSLQSPVCARDEGIYLGFMLAFVALRLIDRGRRSSEPPPLGSTVVLVGLIALMAIDGVTSYAGLRETTNEIRLATGLMAGFGIAGLVWAMLNGQLWHNPGTERVLGKPRELGLFVLSLPVAYVVVRYAFPLLAEGYVLVTAAAIIFTFSSVNLVLVCLIPAFERRAERLRDALLPIGLSVSLTAAMLVLASLLRYQMLRLAGLL